NFLPPKSLNGEVCDLAYELLVLVVFLRLIRLWAVDGLPEIEHLEISVSEFLLFNQGLTLGLVNDAHRLQPKGGGLVAHSEISRERRDVLVANRLRARCTPAGGLDASI